MEFAKTIISTKEALPMDILPVFCDIDDFCQFFEPRWKQRLLSSGEHQRDRAARLCLSEVMTIITLFHASSYRNFKAYDTEQVMKHYAGAFPRLTSDNRFVELMPSALVPWCGYLQTRKGACSGICLIDSTSLKVCHNRRIHSHQVFANCARRGKTSVDWFFGFKLHLVINDCGERLSLRLTPGNVDDRRPVPELVTDLFGKLFGDKGYISQPLFETLYDDGLQLVTKMEEKDEESADLHVRQDYAQEARRHPERDRSTQKHLANRAQPASQCGKLLRQFNRRVDRLYLPGEEAIAQHSCRRAVADSGAGFLSSLIPNSR